MRRRAGRERWCWSSMSGPGRALFGGGIWYSHVGTLRTFVWANQPVVDVEFADLDVLGKLQQVLFVLLQVRRAQIFAVRGLHGLPVGDGSELRDVAPYLPELLHAEAARLLLDLEQAVLVVVAQVLVRQFPAGSPEPRPRNEYPSVRSGRQNLLLPGGVGL